MVAACMASVVCSPSRSAFDSPPPPAPTTYSFGLSALPQCIFRTMRVLGACFAPQLLRAKSSATLASAIGWLASRSHSLGHRRARGRLTKQWRMNLQGRGPRWRPRRHRKCRPRLPPRRRRRRHRRRHRRRRRHCRRPRRNRRLRAFLLRAHGAASHSVGGLSWRSTRDSPRPARQPMCDPRGCSTRSRQIRSSISSSGCARKAATPTPSRPCATTGSTI